MNVAEEKAKNLLGLFIGYILKLFFNILNFIFYPFKKVCDMLYPIITKLFENIHWINFMIFFIIFLLVVYGFYQLKNYMREI